jgi:DDE domain
MRTRSCQGGRRTYRRQPVVIQFFEFVLVQTRRNKQAALKLMRKLLKKYGFVPDKLVTDELRSYAAAAHDLGIVKRRLTLTGTPLVDST